MNVSNLAKEMTAFCKQRCTEETTKSKRRMAPLSEVSKMVLQAVTAAFMMASMQTSSTPDERRRWTK